MKFINKQDIIKIYNREQKYLYEAVKNGSDPYHFFSLSTINQNNADSRIVVLRNVSLSPFKIFFNCDIRSPKAKQIKNQKYCKALFYNQKRRIQIRLDCIIHLYFQDTISQKVWESTPLQSRKCYMGDFEPSSKLKKWNPNVPIQYIDKDPEQIDSNRGYNNFMHIGLEVIKSDILELHYDGHIRFSVNNSNTYTFLAP